MGRQHGYRRTKTDDIKATIANSLFRQGYRNIEAIDGQTKTGSFSATSPLNNLRGHMNQSLSRMKYLWRSGAREKFIQLLENNAAEAAEAGAKKKHRKGDRNKKRRDKQAKLPQQSKVLDKEDENNWCCFVCLDLYYSKRPSEEVNDWTECDSCPNKMHISCVLEGHCEHTKLMEIKDNTRYKFICHICCKYTKCLTASTQSTINLK